LAKKFELGLNEKTGMGGTIEASPNGKLRNLGIEPGLVSRSKFTDDGFDQNGYSLNFLQI